MSESPSSARPEISVVVVVHNMAREAPRTLYSLSAAYQRQIGADEYEVIVVDNGSSPPLGANAFEGLAGNFRLIRLDSAPPSPAHAINVGLAAAHGAVVGVMIDGARIASPGLLHFARTGARLYPVSVVATLGWYLGFDQQRWAAEAGYNVAREDALLASIDWPNDGYRLFEISALDEPSIDGWFTTMSESNALFLCRESWDALGGVEERFDAPGGGLLNIDTFRRAIELPGSKLVVLLGEGTFHQLHGGIATNARVEDLSASLGKWRKQYEDIRGKWRATAIHVRDRTYIGVLPRIVLAHFVRAAVEPARISAYGPPLGHSFDRSLWSQASPPRSSDPVLAGLLDLAETEFRNRNFEAAASVARLARTRAPDAPGPQHLLAQAGAWLTDDRIANFRKTYVDLARTVVHFARARDRGSLECKKLLAQLRTLLTGRKSADKRQAAFHLARAKAFSLLGDTAQAVSEYRRTLALNADLVEARAGLSRLTNPADHKNSDKL